MESYQREAEAIDVVMTMHSAGWPLIVQRLERLVPEAKERLVRGGKDQYEKNLGHLQGVEQVVTVLRAWYEEASKITHHAREETDRVRA